MKDIKLKKRLDELCGKNGYISNENNIILFNEYERDKANNVSKQDSEARALLILGNLKLVYFILNSKMGISYVSSSLEEFSVGELGLIKAVETYQLNSNIKFSTYAIKVILNEVMMYYRNMNLKKCVPENSKVSLEDCINEFGDTFSLKIVDENYIEDFVKQIEDNEMIDKIIKNMKYLKYYEQTAIIYTFGLFGKDVLTQHEIAKIIKLSRPSVSRLLSQGLRKLKILIQNINELSAEERAERYIILREYKEKVDNTFEFVK